MAQHAALVGVLLASCHAVWGCSTIAVGRGATQDGSVIGVHTNDGNGDAPGQIHKVLAADHPAGSIRPPGVPQANHTYGYISEGYASMNEHQVGLSESTCSAVYTAISISQGGKALLDIVQLGQIGLERAKTARSAITTMGELAEKYGFFASASQAGAGESLLVTDTVEGWIFHVLPDSAGSGAIWGAQRIPDSHATAVMNCFVIRDMTLSDTENFMASSNIRDEAAKLGWGGGDTLDFSLHFSVGEAGSHKYSSGRRVWEALRRLAPSLHLNAEYDDLILSRPYPVTVEVESKVLPEDILEIMRSHYEGTPYDLTVGMAAGPWGSPHRWIGGEEVEPTGWWERSISTFRTIMATLVHSRAWLPDEIGGVLWVGPHAAHTSCFIPLAVGMQEVPPGYANTTGSLDRSKAWWVHRILLNVAQLKFSYAIRNISDAQAQAEGASRGLVASLDKAYTAKNMTFAEVSQAYLQNAAETVSTFSALGDTLLQYYADGFCNGCGAPSHILPYPAWWLSQVGFTNHTSVVEGGGGGSAGGSSAKRCVDACPDASPASYEGCVQRCFK